MLFRPIVLLIGTMMGFPAFASAEGPAGHLALDLPLWSVVPFSLLLLSIALLPLVHGHWWHSNRNKALVVLGITMPVLVYLIYQRLVNGLPTLEILGDKGLEYVSFILLLGSLYIVSGGIVISGDLHAKPATNLAFLLLGAALANLIGTTGASILLIRPVLRINRHRQRKWHLPVFFIFVVSNTGGLLTPLGDPPLFLGFLGGVPFAWTFSLYPMWLVVNGALLALFYVWDILAFRKEPAAISQPDGSRTPEPLRVHGLINLVFLASIIVTVLLQGTLTGLVRELAPPLLLVGIGLLSLASTPKGLRTLNAFTWEPILEVTVLFAGIFVTMIPALQILAVHGARLGITEPWQFFWLTGVLSSFLDNAPTYLTFASLASGEHDLGWLAANHVQILRAISSGAVFMGALTYIGNGPNFMIKAIAQESGYEMPSFFGYLAISCGILLPIFVLVTVLFFR